MKLGAFHYVTKPLDVEEIVLLARSALETIRLCREVRAPRGSRQREYAFDAIIGTSSAVQKVKTLLASVAASPASTMLLTGEIVWLLGRVVWLPGCHAPFNVAAPANR
jgi:DNA-binding NtrC family response regulator